MLFIRKSSIGLFTNIRKQNILLRITLALGIPGPEPLVKRFIRCHRASCLTQPL